MANAEYTKIWEYNFDLSKVKQYDDKFLKRFEKNITHNLHINFIKKYLNENMTWCDCPIGSGRLMNSLKTNNMYGFDRSKSFLEFNKNKNIGINCVEGDLYQLPFVDKFEFITCLLTLFAFEDYFEIIKGLHKSLKQNGILVFDFVNEEHITKTNHLSKYEYSGYSYKKDVLKFLDDLGFELLDIQPYEYWDNRYFINWQNSGNRVSKWFKRKIYKSLNFFYFHLRLKKIFLWFQNNAKEENFGCFIVAVKKR